MDKFKFQYEGLKWLYELEMLNHPQLINNVKLNILMLSKHVKEVELLIYRENKSMLVQVELTWVGRRNWIKQRIFLDIQDLLIQLLPSFRFRVTDDPEIMKMAVERVKRALTGGAYASSNDVSVSRINDTGRSDVPKVDVPVSKESTPSGDGSNSNPKEQSKTAEELRSEASDGDSGKK